MLLQKKDIIKKRLIKITIYQKRKLINRMGVMLLCTRKELTFSIFLIHKLSQVWEKPPTIVYDILNTTNIMDDYVLKCYDVLHSQGTKALVEDITEYVKEKGVTI